MAAVKPLKIDAGQIQQFQSGDQIDEALIDHTLRPLSHFFEYDDFSSGSQTSGSVGDLGWIFSTGTATVTSPTAVAGRPGLFRFATIAVATSLVRVHPRIDSSIGVFVPADSIDFVFIFRLNQSDADTQMRVGLFSDAVGNPPANGIYLEKLGADTNWFYVTRAGSIETRTDSGIATSTNFIRFRVRRVSSTTIGFTLDSGSEVTHTINIPTAAMLSAFQIRTAVNTAKSFDADYYHGLITGLSR